MLSPSVRVERRDRRAAAGFVDAVFEFLEPARGARGDHDMRAPRGERSRAIASPMPRLAP